VTKKKAKAKSKPKVKPKIKKKVVRMQEPLVLGIAHHSPLDVVLFAPESEGYKYLAKIPKVPSGKTIVFADAGDLIKAKIPVLDEKNNRPVPLSADIFRKHLGK
jgi:hypothetical protein